MTAHPLDPLSAEEFRAVAAVLRREKGVGEGWAASRAFQASASRAAGSSCTRITGSARGLSCAFTP